MIKLFPKFDLPIPFPKLIIYSPVTCYNYGITTTKITVLKNEDNFNLLTVYSSYIYKTKIIKTFEKKFLEKMTNLNALMLVK